MKPHFYASCDRSCVKMVDLLWQIIDLLATDKLEYLAQPRPITVNYIFIDSIFTQ